MILNSTSNEICYIFLQSVQLLHRIDFSRKPSLNEYILVALITDLDKKKRKKQTQCKELYIYKTTTTIFFFVYCEMHEIQ